jgi:hypothetical protein
MDESMKKRVIIALVLLFAGLWISFRIMMEDKHPDINFFDVAEKYQHTKVPMPNRFNVTHYGKVDIDSPHDVYVLKDTVTGKKYLILRRMDTISICPME